MNSIHPSAILEGDITIGTGNTIGAHAVIYGPVTIGDDNWIGAGVVIGAPPEVRSFSHPRHGASDEIHGVVIGDRNVIREYAQIHQGWKATTTVGDDTFIMNQVYVAHDCRLGDGVTLASSVLLAGHVQIGAGANLGLGASVHQGRYVGDAAMVGMAAVVTRDSPPYAKAYGSPARVVGANVIGMRRSSIADTVIADLSHLFESADWSEGVIAFSNAVGLENAIDAWRTRHHPAVAADA